ncbi:hypothetical protein F5144DRAFT_230034 [Chaetomium tenue]|uniref:Uncharacterized protein n=1 Tax=Chaetomium tenue TaxID=1854479 RepID=A0ACB7P669_9PEZI|nr:hypothetical protein F5144DRAFT_230034 [Chaetomium globosum]
MDKSHNALSVLSMPDDELKSRLKDLKRKSIMPGNISTRQLKSETAALKEELEELAATHDQQRPKKRHRKGQGGAENTTPRSGAQHLLMDLNDTVLLQTFISKVKQGVVKLRRSPSGRNSTTGGSGCFRYLLEYRDRQPSGEDDTGEELECTLKKMADAAESCATVKSSTGFICRFISPLVQHLRRRIDPKYSKTGHSDSEKGMRKTEGVSVAMCRIVNGLQRHKNVEALVVLNALVESKYKASAIRNMSRERRDAFVSSAIDQLASVDLSVPSHTRLFHPAAFVYWALPALGLNFATICNFLELDAFSAIDPSLELDALAEGWLRSEIPFAMTMPLSECQNIAGVENSLGAASDDRSSSPRVGAGQYTSLGPPTQWNTGGQICNGAPSRVSAASEPPPPHLDFAGRDPSPNQTTEVDHHLQRAGAAPAGLLAQAAGLYSIGLIDPASIPIPLFLNPESGQPVYGDRYEDTGVGRDGTRNLDQVFVGYEVLDGDFSDF